MVIKGTNLSLADDVCYISSPLWLFLSNKGKMYLKMIVVAYCSYDDLFQHSFLITGSTGNNICCYLRPGKNQLVSRGSSAMLAAA